MRFHNFLSAFLALLAFCLFAPDLSAQVDDGGGPIVDIELVPVCDDGTVAFHRLMNVVGSATPVSLGYVDAAGAAYTLSGGTLTAGYCEGAGGTPTPDNDYLIAAMCDDGTPFYRIIIYTPTNGPLTNDVDLEFADYTPSGTVNTGPCSTTITAAITRTISTTTGSITTGATSFEICNTGTANGTVTIGGGSAGTLIPGSCTRFSATYNPATRQYQVAPAVAYVATGTSFTVIVQQ